MIVDGVAHSANEIPQEMISARRWCVWRYNSRGQGKPTKVPVQPNGLGAKSNDPDTWVYHHEAAAACEADTTLEGVGFMLGGDWSGIDLDDCIDADGELSPGAEKIVSEAGSYTEVSPSGTGLKVFVRGTVPYKGGRKGTIEGREVEVYGAGRYFTVTGARYAESPTTVEPAQETLDDLIRQLGGAGTSIDTSGIVPSWPDTPSVDLAEYKARLLTRPDAVEGEHGSDTTFGVACAIRRLDLCEDDSWEVFEHYNATKCHPPWDHAELRRKFNEGCKDVLAKRELHSADNEFEPVETDGTTPTFRKYTLAELTSQHPKLNKPVVDGLFREGETCNIVAAPKIGKSWLGYGLALSIASGRLWLDRFEVSKGKVLIVDNELHPSTLASRLTRVANAMGISMDDLADTIEVWPLRGALKSLARLSADFDLLKPGEVKAVILDAKYRFAVEGQSENDNATETTLYNLVDHYAMKTKAAFVLVHHSSKGDQSGKAITDVGAGAGAQARAVDCHAVLRQHEAEDCVVLEAAVRSFAPVEPITLRFEYPTWAPDAALDPSHLATKDSNRERQKRNDKRDKETLLRELGAIGEATVSKLSKIMSIGSPRLTRLMKELVSEGKATVAESLVSGNMCKVYTPTVEGSDVGV